MTGVTPECTGVLPKKYRRRSDGASFFGGGVVLAGPQEYQRGGEWFRLGPKNTRGGGSEFCLAGGGFSAKGGGESIPTEK